MLCGGVCALMKAGFETLIEAGYQPERILNAYTRWSCIDLVNSGGLSFMRYSISDTAEYGDYTVGGRIITKPKGNEEVLSEIRTAFARNWILEAGEPSVP